MFFFLILVLSFVFTDDIRKGTVYYSYNDQKFKFIEGKVDNDGVAWGYYYQTYMKTGWDGLYLFTHRGDKYSDFIKAEGVGYLEGSLTREKIWDHFVNLNAVTWRNQTQMPQEYQDFFIKQSEYMNSIYKKNSSSSFYKQVELIRLQTVGLNNGYNDIFPSHPISFAEMNVMTSFGDILGIHFNLIDNKPDLYEMEYEDVRKYLERFDHCSALFKITDDLNDIFYGHCAWYYLSSMTRIFKEYNLVYDGVKSTISFSSYPATLASNDDFLVTESNLVVIETTNNIFNLSLFDYITPNSLLVWQRVLIASRLADNGENWCQYFSTHVSGTYTNQYMVLDMKKFKPKKALVPGTLWVVEEIPLKTVYDDQTEVLAKTGYWPSYNVPFYKEIYNISGYTEYLKKHPEAADSISYEHCARANIFRRDQSKVTDIDAIKAILRYNDYKNDPLSKSNPGFAIASRKDLDTTRVSCSGAYDAKCSSYNEWNKNGKLFYVAGPTSTADYIDPFSWKNSKSCQQSKYNSFQGMPEVFNFDWQEYTKSK